MTNPQNLSTPAAHLDALPESSVLTEAPSVPPHGEAFTELSTRHLGPVRSYFVKHPVAMDVLVMAWFGIPAILTALVSPAFTVVSSQADAFLLLATSVAGIVALWWRRRAPVIALISVTVLGVIALGFTGNSNGFELASALCIYAVAAGLGARPAWIAFAFSTVILAGTTLLTDFAFSSVSVTADASTEVDPWTVRILSMVMFALFNLVAVAIGNGVHNRRLHVAALIDRGNRLALERDQREQLAVIAERSRIAREMHDVVAHSLTVMITLSDGAAGIAVRDPDRARSTMEDVSETGRSALSDMRRVLGVLRAETDEGTPLAPAPTHGVDDLVAQFRNAGLPVELISQGPPLPLDAGLRLAVFRIVQESLTNVLRYAPLASTITVTISREVGAIEVIVTNTSGSGNRPKGVGSGRGLIGMRERVAVFGGSLETGPTANGWLVRAVLPWEDAL